MKNIDFKKLIPHLAAIGLFIVISFGYMLPTMEGKRLKQDDIVRFKGMSKEIMDYREETGEEALWTNGMFGGMPAYQISVIYKNNVARYIDLILKLGFPHPASVLFLNLLGFYILMMCLRLNPWLAIGAAIAFGFSSYFFIILQAGHNSKAQAIAYMAPVLAGILLTFRDKLILGGALTALGLALQSVSNHPQITYYLLLTVLVLGAFETVKAIREKSLPDYAKKLGILLIAAIIGVGTNTASLWSTLEYSKVTIRGKSEITLGEESKQTSGLDKDYATAWSYGKAETLTLIIPNAVGGSSMGFTLDEGSETYDELKKNYGKQQADDIIKYIGTYWGPQTFTSGPVYLGAIVCFLFILGLFVVKGHLKWWLFTATLLSILLSWGKNFMPLTEFFLDYFPAYNKFRAVSMTLVIAQITVPILAFLSLREIVLDKVDKKTLMNGLKYSLGIIGGITLIMFAFGGAFFDFQNEGDSGRLLGLGFPETVVPNLLSSIETDRAGLFRSDSFRSLAFVLLTGALLFAFIKKKVKLNVFVIGLTALIFLDMAPVGKRYLNNIKDKDKKTGKMNYRYWVTKKEVREPHQPSQADLTILQDTDPNFRVFNQLSRLDQDSRTPYFHKAIGGYHGAKLKRYQQLIDHQIYQNNFGVLNMLNAKYIIGQNQQGQQVASRNPGALGNAWFVESYDLVENPDSELVALTGFDPAKVAVVDDVFEQQLQGFQPKKDEEGYITLTDYKPNHLIYKTKASSEQLAVFSEIYYAAGWKAYVDGKPAPHFRVNFVLRAMRIPEGEHQVEFSFEPKAHYVGETLSMIFSILLVLGLIGGVYLSIKKKQPEEEI